MSLLRRRLTAFALDYLLIAAYLALLAGIGSALAFGPTGERWQAFVSTPARLDVLAFCSAVLPVILYFSLMEGSSRESTLGKRRMGLRVVRAGGGRLGHGRSLLRSVVQFLPWQLAHTSLLHIPGWPAAPAQPPSWVVVGMSATWNLAGIYLLTLVLRGDHRTPYDWIAGSEVVRSEAGMAAERAAMTDDS
jgi:uncharacterized RDD family membrane protein YckC